MSDCLSGQIDQEKIQWIEPVKSKLNQSGLLSPFSAIQHQKRNNQEYAKADKEQGMIFRQQGCRAMIPQSVSAYWNLTSSVSRLPMYISCFLFLLLSGPLHSRFPFCSAVCRPSLIFSIVGIPFHVKYLFLIMIHAFLVCFLN